MQYSIQRSFRNLSFFDNTGSTMFSRRLQRQLQQHVGIQTETCGEGGLDVGYIDNGDYTVYNNVNLNGVTVSRESGQPGSAVTSRFARQPHGNLARHLHLCAPRLQAYTDASCTLSGASGYHNVYLVYSGASMWNGSRSSKSKCHGAVNYNSESA